MGFFYSWRLPESNWGHTDFQKALICCYIMLYKYSIFTVVLFRCIRLYLVISVSMECANLNSKGGLIRPPLQVEWIIEKGDVRETLCPLIISLMKAFL